RPEGRFRQRCSQQQDTEIGVAAGHRPGPLDPLQDARADADARGGEAGSAGDRARLEIGDAHAMAGGVIVDIARLERPQLGPAGGEKGVADERAAHPQAFTLAAGRAMAATASRWSASAWAMLIALTRCSAAQAGLLLTSGTCRRPHPSRMMSTPA